MCRNCPPHKPTYYRSQSLKKLKRILRVAPAFDHDAPTMSPSPATALEVYRPVYRVMHIFGSSGFVHKKELKGLVADKERVHGQDTESNGGGGNFEETIIFKPSCLYYASKFVFCLHFVYFLVRFYNMIECEDEVYCGRAKGVYLLALLTYITCQLMVIAIMAWSHWKREEICEFFTTYNLLDNQIFGDGT